MHERLFASLNGLNRRGSTLILHVAWSGRSVGGCRGIGNDVSDGQHAAVNASSQTAKAPPDQSTIKSDREIAQTPSHHDPQQPADEDTEETAADCTTQGQSEGLASFAHGGRLPESRQAKKLSAVWAIF